MWKVTGCDGTVANDVTISGFNMAFEAGVDVISSSIDFDDGWAEGIFLISPKPQNADA